jgi:asparagine synthetase B (glutamine-hydrolysing)
MARAVLACFRHSDPERDRLYSALMGRIVARLQPGGGQQESSVTDSGDGVISLCFAQNKAVQTERCSVLLGHAGNKGGDWARPESGAPDGTFAAFRVSNGQVELLTDAMATRKIWYYLDDDKLLASSSQRALVMLLGSYQSSRQPLAWMLANGVLGPEGGWDARIQSLPPSGRLTLDRGSWESRTRREPLSFVPEESGEDWPGLYQDTMVSVIDSLGLDPERWLLPLSGGYDSRILACLLSGKGAFRSITWGTGDDRFGTRPEAEVAARLADALGFSHGYRPLDVSRFSLEKSLKRFVAINEGQSDQFLGYRDGFALWQGFADAGIEGVILGDEAFGGFGWSPVHDEKSVRTGLGLNLMQEVPGVAGLADSMDIEQCLPESLARQDGEDLLTWRYRLYHEYRIPVVRAAMNETKAAFVEVVNPHQFRPVVELVRRLPHRYRTDKKLLIGLAGQLSPDIPYKNAREGDLLERELRDPVASEFLRDELASGSAIAMFGRAAVNRVLNGLAGSDVGGQGRGSVRKRVETRLRAGLPRFVKQRLKRFMPVPGVSSGRVALRMWMAVEVDRLLIDDAGEGVKGLRG